MTEFSQFPEGERSPEAPNATNAIRHKAWNSSRKRLNGKSYLINWGAQTLRSKPYPTRQSRDSPTPMKTTRCRSEWNDHPTTIKICFAFKTSNNFNNKLYHTIAHIIKYNFWFKVALHLRIFLTSPYGSTTRSNPWPIVNSSVIESQSHANSREHPDTISDFLLYRKSSPECLRIYLDRK